MKRRLFVIPVLIIIYGFIPHSVYSGTVSIGAQVWYAWWEPAWGNTEYTADPSITVSQSSKFYNPDPSFMAGPLFSIGFYDQWNFSVSGVYGGYSTRGVRQPASSILVFEEMDIKKYDIDSALNFIMNRYIKIFAGLKVQGYDYTKNLHQLREGNPPSYQWEQYKDTTYKSYGPGLGIGLSVPLGERFFALLNGNVLMLYASEKTDLVKYIFNPVISIEKYNYDGKARLYGANGTISFGYLIPDSRLTVTAGLRYQSLYYVQAKSDAGEYYFDGKTDRFYGMLMSAVYSFDI